jgi:alpha-beta hydrolase superfamily lysophospholipase
MFREVSLTTPDRLTLYGWTREPDAPPRGVIAHVHGMGEHSRRYDHVTAYWEAQGYASAGFDLRGHGRSEGRRGHTPSYDQLMDDIAAFLAMVADRWRGLPLTLYGHSMGGNLVLNYAIRRQPALTRVVATAPYLRLVSPPSAARVRLAGWLARVVPTVSQRTGLDAAAVSRDPAVVQRYLADPLVHDLITVGFFSEVHPAGEAAIARAAELRIPTLVMHGSADRITSPLGSKAFVDRAGAQASLRLWDGSYHEIHNEPAWADVTAFVVAWLAASSSGLS